MLQREYVQEYQDDMGTSGTKTYNLDFSDPITELVIGIDATNGASGNVDNPIESCISKIELVDGGEVLWDLPGDVALAYASHLKGKLPVSNRTGAINDTPYQVIPVCFGRFPYDPVFGFNPLAHKNPQLRVTFDEATIRAAGATGYVSDSFALTLIVRLMEQMAQPPPAFLSARLIETFTSVASGDYPVIMPTDRVIRALLTRVYEAGVYFGTDISKMKLSIDGGKRVPFEMYSWNITDLMAELFAPLTVPYYTYCDGNETYDTWLAHDHNSTVRGHVSSQIVGASSPAQSQITVYSNSHDGSVLAQPVHISVTGWGFHNLMIYPFGDINNPADWLDPRNARKLDYILTQGGAGAEVDVAVETVYTY